MKVLLPDGIGGFFTQIIPNGAPPKRPGQHDPWCSHGTCLGYGPISGTDPSQPLVTAPALTFQLKNGAIFSYYYGDFTPCFSGSLRCQAALEFTFGNGGAFYQGLGFNYLLRPGGGAKLTEAQFGAYLAALGNNSATC